MNEISSVPPTSSVSDRLPALFRAVPDGSRCFWEFFAVNLRNPNTRRAYFKAVEGFAAWCEERRPGDLAGVTPMAVAGVHQRDLRERELACIYGIELAYIAE